MPQQRWNTVSVCCWERASGRDRHWIWSASEGLAFVSRHCESKWNTNGERGQICSLFEGRYPSSPGLWHWPHDSQASGHRLTYTIGSSGPATCKWHLWHFLTPLKQSPRYSPLRCLSLYPDPFCIVDTLVSHDLIGLFNQLLSTRIVWSYDLCSVIFKSLCSLINSYFIPKCI